MKKLIFVWMILAIPAWAAETPVETHVSGYLELRGAPKKVQSVLDQLTKEEAYGTAGCKALPPSKNGKVVGISCTNPDSALMQLLSLGTGTGVKLSLTAQGCPTGCTNMTCPPLSSPVACCKKTATGYKRCDLTLQ